MPAPLFAPSAPVMAYCTAPADAADALAHALIERRLAACVNLLSGMRSLYRWEGHIAEENEVVLIIKTTGAKTEALKAFLDAEHPYDTPCCLLFDAKDALPAFVQWLGDETIS